MSEPSVHNTSSASSPVADQLYVEEPYAVMVARLTIEVTVAFLGFLGNVLVSFVIAQQNRFRSGIKLFIMNLAFADLGILAISFPFAVVKEQLPMYWPFGKVICMYFYPLAEVFHAVSVWSITAIAVERYRNIVAGVRRPTYISTKPIKWGIFTVWFVSFLVVSLPLLFVMEHVENDTGVFCVITWSRAMHNAYVIFLTVFWYLLPLGIIIFTYVKISEQIHKSNKFHKSSLKRRSREIKISDLTSSTEEGKRLKQNSKAKNILTPIVFVFAISMLPLNVLRVLLLFWEDLIFHKYFLVIYNICVIGVVINSASDPLIYSIVSQDFRSEFKVSFQFTKRMWNLVKFSREEKTRETGAYQPKPLAQDHKQDQEARKIPIFIATTV